MKPFKYHVLICTQQRLEKKPYCSEPGGAAVLEQLQRLVHERQLDQQIQITPCGCLGLCQQGPNLIIYPEGIWYSRVTLEDVEEIVQSHFIEGRPVARLRQSDVEATRRSILKENKRSRAAETARREAGVLPVQLQRLSDDFRASRAFLSAVELDLFSAVGDGASVAVIAEHIGADPRATEMHLNTLTAMGLLTKKDGIYENGTDASRYLRRGFPDDARAALMHRVNMWDRWSTLSECVREGSAMNFNTHTGPTSTQAYIAATHRIAALAAPALVSSLDLKRVSRVLDVGGGSGAYTVAVLKAFPEATADIVDLPSIVRVTTRYIREAELEHRIKLQPADFTIDPLGTGFDLVLLSYIMHLYPQKTVETILTKAFKALVPGGQVVINDYVLNDDKTLPRVASLQALTMLVSTRGGNVYSKLEYKKLLENSGFEDVHKVPLMGPTDVITARKP